MVGSVELRGLDRSGSGRLSLRSACGHSSGFGDSARDMFLGVGGCRVAGVLVAGGGPGEEGREGEGEGEEIEACFCRWKGFSVPSPEDDFLPVTQ